MKHPRSNIHAQVDQKNEHASTTAFNKQGFRTQATLFHVSVMIIDDFASAKLDRPFQQRQHYPA